MKKLVFTVLALASISLLGFGRTEGVPVYRNAGPGMDAEMSERPDTAIVAPEKFTEKINASVIKAKLPKKLRTRVPFWGTPVNHTADSKWPSAEFLLWQGPSVGGDPEIWGIQEDSVSVWSPNPLTGIANWTCWNADLADMGGERDRFLRRCVESKVLMDRALWAKIINECYKWAWAKPYGNVNIVCGPMYDTRDCGKLTKDSVPYAFFAVVCKKEPTAKVGATGFRSVGFVLPNKALTSVPSNIYNLSRTVNNIEYFTGYDFFPKLPESIQEIVEEMTVYELFCPFQELEEQLYDEDEMIFSPDGEFLYDSFQMAD